MNFNQELEPSEREYVYDLFKNYFNDPEMTKIKDVNDYSMYVTKINALLGIEYRYLIIFVHIDGYPVKSKENLSKLPWISLQTRTLKEEYDLQSYAYYNRHALSNRIRLTFKDDNQYVYSVDDIPITVTLLPKRGVANEYSNTGTIASALETYQTIISFNK